MYKALALALVLLFSGAAFASPKCTTDTFTGEKTCSYGGQIVTKNGKMYYHMYIMEINGEPLNIDAMLFRIDDQRTIRLPAANVSTPSVDCLSRHLCTWSWTAAAQISAENLIDLSKAKKLIIAAEDKNHRRTSEGKMKKGGAIFQKYLDEIRANEPEILTQDPVIAREWPQQANP